MKVDDERISGLGSHTWKFVLGAEIGGVESGRGRIGGGSCVAGARGGSARVRRPSARALRVVAGVFGSESQATPSGREVRDALGKDRNAIAGGRVSGIRDSSARKVGCVQGVRRTDGIVRAGLFDSGAGGPGFPGAR
jgi:hypothetical protein